MNFIAFWITAMVIIGISLAVDDDETSIDNQIAAENNIDSDFVDTEVEGRSCIDCHGGVSSHEYIDHGNHINFGDPASSALEWILGSLGLKGIGLLIIPVVGLEIAIVILLAIILKWVKVIAEGLSFHEEPNYAYTYQTYDAGPAPSYGTAPSYGGYSNHGATSYGGGAANNQATGGYVKRTTRGAPNFASRSTLEYATNLFEKAFEKYTHIDDVKV